MANQYKNKVIYNGQTLIDLTEDTVEASKVLDGYTFHAPSGATVEGTCTYDADTSDANATASEILSGKTAYKGGSKLTGSMPNRGAVTLTIDDATDELTIPNGYHDGSGKAKLDATEKAKIIPSNILEGVTILGVTGTVEPSSDIRIESNKEVTPSASQQVITPSENYDVMAQVTVKAIPYTETDNPQGGVTVTIG